MNEVLHLKTTKQFQRKSNDQSEIVINKFIESCIKLDASIFEPFMDEEDIFQNKDKYRFLATLQKRFQYYRKLFNNEFCVNRITTKCARCSKGKLVESFNIFKNDQTEKYENFGFVIDLFEGKLIDIYECFHFEGCTNSCPF